MRSINHWWETFSYNFCWSDYVNYIDGWIPKLALTVPIIGYIILFNDSISSLLVFQKIANEGSLSFGLSDLQRLRFLYFGLISLGLSNFIYRIQRPQHFKIGKNLADYTRSCLELLNLGDYSQMHFTIRKRGHLTSNGKYYDSEWDGFVSLATNTNEGTGRALRDGDWEGAKQRCGGLLRKILAETFFRCDIRRRFWLSACLALSTIGYALMVIPSLDLFIKVCASSF
jgi:hypothetical protein|tara:strand:- start:82 stop:765 length:684 start_codon:yes stop_codon:yes gene_type:complete